MDGLGGQQLWLTEQPLVVVPALTSSGLLGVSTQQQPRGSPLCGSHPPTLLSRPGVAMSLGWACPRRLIAVAHRSSSPRAATLAGSVTMSESRFLDGNLSGGLTAAAPQAKARSQWRKSLKTQAKGSVYVLPSKSSSDAASLSKHARAWE